MSSRAAAVCAGLVLAFPGSAAAELGTGSAHSGALATATGA